MAALWFILMEKRVTRGSKVESSCMSPTALPWPAHDFADDAVESSGPVGIQPDFARMSLQEKTFYKYSFFWGNSAEKKLYSGEVLKCKLLVRTLHSLLNSDTSEFLPEEKSLTYFHELMIKGLLFHIESPFITSESVQKSCIWFETQMRTLHSCEKYCDSCDIMICDSDVWKHRGKKATWITQCSVHSSFFNFLQSNFSANLFLIPNAIYWRLSKEQKFPFNFKFFFLWLFCLF